MDFEVRYSWPNKMLHRIGFASGGIQVALADVEERLFASELGRIAVDAPVFVTALPRAGTTILLNLLVQSGRFASHTYRDLPFVLCPLLWFRLTAPFQTREKPRERAHGDGLLVSVDSPEAFEEMVWRHFWPAHYRSDRIDTWQSCDDPEFMEFMRSHIKRVILLRKTEPHQELRYVSKNNLNVSRLDCLTSVFPDARIIVPFREPVQHAASLLRQHLAFLEAHRADNFARAYMEGIGHYDFGLNLRPVDFDSWLGDADRRSEAEQLSFWIEYWVAAYEYVLDRASSGIHLLSYRQLTERPAEALERIAAAVDVGDDSVLTDQVEELRLPRDHNVDLAGIDAALLDRARQVFAELDRCSET